MFHTSNQGGNRERMRSYHMTLSLEFYEGFPGSNSHRGIWHAVIIGSQRGLVKHLFKAGNISLVVFIAPLCVFRI